MPIKITNPKSQILNPKHPPSLKLWGIVLRSLGEGEQIPIPNVQNPKLKFWSLTIWSLVIVCGLVLSAWNFMPCYAAPCYGTKMPEKNKFFIGAQNNTVFKRYLEDEYGKLRSTQYFLLLSYGVYDWLSLDLKGGAGNLKVHPVGSDEIDYPSSFAGGYGFRLRLYDKQKIKIVFGFQHISVHPKRVHLGDTEHKAILDDWQASFLVSRDFGKITPYLGTKWSRTDYIHWIEESKKREMSDRTKSFGLILGLDIPLAKQIWLNLEGQLFDVEAATFSLNYSF